MSPCISVCVYNEYRPLPFDQYLNRDGGSLFSYSFRQDHCHIAVGKVCSLLTGCLKGEELSCHCVIAPPSRLIVCAADGEKIKEGEIVREKSQRVRV